MQETLNSKKQGDAAFRAKDFATAIDCYTEVSTLFRISFKAHPKIRISKKKCIKENCLCFMQDSFGF